MNFPHPVLANWRDDFKESQFSVDVSYREDKADGRLELSFTGALDCPAINALVTGGKAMLGCFVVCRATGVRRLVELGTLPSSYTFGRGELLDTVNLRPLVWMISNVSDWSPVGVHDEFSSPQMLRKGDIVAMAEELTIEVRKDDLPALETIFDLNVNDQLPKGQFEVHTMRDRITIQACRDTYNLVELLRATQGASASVVMNSLYIPVVMSVLTEIARSGAEQFEEYRWLEPFRRRYVKLDITPSVDTAFQDAHKLLDSPFHDLEKLTGGE